MHWVRSYREFRPLPPRYPGRQVSLSPHRDPDSCQDPLRPRTPHSSGRQPHRSGGVLHDRPVWRSDPVAPPWGPAMSSLSAGAASRGADRPPRARTHSQAVPGPGVAAVGRSRDGEEEEAEAGLLTGSNKSGFTKVHLAEDGRGLPLAVVVTPGNVNDSTVFDTAAPSLGAPSRAVHYAALTQPRGSRTGLPVRGRASNGSIAAHDSSVSSWRSTTNRPASPTLCGPGSGPTAPLRVETVLRDEAADEVMRRCRGRAGFRRCPRSCPRSDAPSSRGASPPSHRSRRGRGPAGA